MTLVSARLNIDGSPVPLSDFSFNVPERAIGSELTLTLADITAVLTENTDVTFEIGVGDGSGLDWATLMDVGRVTSENKVVAVDQNGTPTDRLEINAISSLTDRLETAPRIPVVLYDPDQIDVVTATESVQGDVVDQDGDPIEPDLVAIQGLDLSQLMNYVYVEQLGFTEVITNIASFPLKQAIFPLTATLRSVVDAEIAGFDPVFVADDALRLWIIDPQGILPTGLEDTVLNITQSAYVDVSWAKQRSGSVNAVLLTVRNDTQSGTTLPEIVDRVVQEPFRDVGSYGEAGWQRISITRFYKDFLDGSGRSINYRTLTITYARVGVVVRDIMIEDQTDSYKYDWRLKTGHTKTVKVLSRLPGVDTLAMRDAHTEVNTIEYVITSDGSEAIKVGEVTQTSGTILRVENPDDPSNPTRTSLFDANRNEDFPEDATVETPVTISSRIDEWQEVGPDQIVITYQPLNQLTSKPLLPRTENHTGTLRVRLRDERDTTTTRLIRNLTAEAEIGPRVPVSMQAGNIPVETALGLAERLLARRGNEPTRVAITYAGLDLSLRRGSLRVITDREALTDYLIMITGYQISANAPDFKIKQTATGILLNG